MNKLLLATLLGVATSASAQTAVKAEPLRFVVGLGLAAGGDKLVTSVLVEETGERSFVDTKAGNGAGPVLGIDYRLSPAFSMQATVAYLTDMTEASNGSVRFSRYPIELIGYFHPSDTVRVGAGLRSVNNVTLSGSGYAEGYDAEFGDTNGVLLEVEYAPSPTWGVKLRGVKEDYKIRGYSKRISGDHVGLVASYYF